VDEDKSKSTASLCLIEPEISAEELVSQLMPPPEFASSSFENYLPDPNFPSQAAALAAVKKFETGKSSLFSRSEPARGIYLDGGFGVGKTHLLAALWHSFRGKKAFGTFLEYTSLVGYLGFQETVNRLAKFNLICIDEFELDDPGDTMILSRLLKELERAGVRFAATSNTPPNALGQGRFAADDFKREIQGLGSRFQIISIDGEDYRHRAIDSHSHNLSMRELADWVSYQSDPYLDRFADLLSHLGKLHPTKYRPLIMDVGALGIHDVYQLRDQVAALRFVVFVDRLYEQQIPLRTQGDIPITDVFSQEMLEGGYKKKYLRAVSRLGALCELY
jgi:cell division protein ZapE